jgi:hypothetical protein
MKKEPQPGLRLQSLSVSATDGSREDARKFQLEHFQAKRIPVRVKKMRQNKRLELPA